MVRDEGEKKTQQPVKRPNTVNIYSQEDDLILKSDRRLQGDDDFGVSQVHFHT